MEYRAARPSEPDERLSCFALWHRGDPRQFSAFEKARQFFARYSHPDPSFRDDYCSVATATGQIVSTVSDFRSDVGLRREPVPMGAIGCGNSAPW